MTAALKKEMPLEMSFRVAMKEWLSGEAAGHLGTYMYTDDSTDARWKKGHSDDAYYLGRDDAASLKIALQNINIKVDNVIDLGPGGEDAIVSKAIPLINAVRASHYYGVDLSPTLAEIATDVVGNRLDISASPIVADFFDPLPYKKPKTLIALLGGTLGNLESQADNAAMHKRLTGIFTNYHNAVQGDGYFLVSFDANTNKDEIVACYDNEAMAGLISSCVGRAIDISGFQYDVTWAQETHQLATGLRSAKDQMVEFDGREYPIEAGQFIPVLNSYRFPVNLVVEAAADAGWSLVDSWSSSGRSTYVLFNTY